MSTSGAQWKAAVQYSDDEPRLYRSEDTSCTQPSEPQYRSPKACLAGQVQRYTFGSDVQLPREGNRFVVEGLIHRQGSVSGLHYALGSRVAPCFMRKGHCHTLRELTRQPQLLSDKTDAPE